MKKIILGIAVIAVLSGCNTLPAESPYASRAELLEAKAAAEIRAKGEAFRKEQARLNSKEARAAREKVEPTAAEAALWYQRYDSCSKQQTVIHYSNPSWAGGTTADIKSTCRDSASRKFKMPLVEQRIIDAEIEAIRIAQLEKAQIIEENNEARRKYLTLPLKERQRLEALHKKNKQRKRTYSTGAGIVINVN